MENTRNQQQPDLLWRSPTFAVLVAAALILVALIKTVLIVAFLGVLMGVLLSLPVAFMSRWMPRGLAVVLTLLAGAGLVGGVSYLGYIPLAEQVTQIRTQAPEAIHRGMLWLEHVRQNAGMAPVPSSGHAPIQQNLQKNADSWVGPVLTQTGRTALSVSTVFTGILIVIVLAAFFSSSPEEYQEAVTSSVDRDTRRDVHRLTQQLHVGLKHWLLGILMSMTVMGALCGIGLMAIGIKEWPLLALLTFFGTFVPYIGAVASALPGLALALAQSEQKFLLAGVVYLGVHIVEGYIVHPIIMRRAVLIRPALLLIFELVMVELVGLLGVVVATPLLVCIKIVYGYYFEKSENPHSEKNIANAA